MARGAHDGADRRGERAYAAPTIRARQSSIDENFERAKAWTNLQMRMQRALDAARAEGASEGTAPAAK